MFVRNANNYSYAEYYASECPMSNVFLQRKMTILAPSLAMPPASCLEAEVPSKRG
jgi:hypothetical protein